MSLTPRWARGPGTGPRRHRRVGGEPHARRWISRASDACATRTLLPQLAGLLRADEVLRTRCRPPAGGRWIRSCGRASSQAWIAPTDVRRRCRSWTDDRRGLGCHFALSSFVETGENIDCKNSCGTTLASVPIRSNLLASRSARVGGQRRVFFGVAPSARDRRPTAALARGLGPDPVGAPSRRHRSLLEPDQPRRAQAPLSTIDAIHCRRSIAVRARPTA